MGNERIQKKMRRLKRKMALFYATAPFSSNKCSVYYRRKFNLYMPSKKLFTNVLNN